MSTVISFAQLFTTQKFSMIEIPKFQRDYAQGRQDQVTSQIRQNFLKVLHDALTTGEAVSLDFVYGQVARDIFIPLDGQQRVSALFLLHWYLAARAGIEQKDCEYLQCFTYETRYSSRDFCTRLIEQRPVFPLNESLYQELSDWIQDQTWYVSAWRHDPTIQSMLVVLNDLHRRFKDSDCHQAWERLIDKDNPAITFHFLSIDDFDLGSADELYIKMNSRGKPLTEFEQFKAGFEKTIRQVSEEHYQTFIHKIDNAWSDLFWSLRQNKDDVVDDKFMRYFGFITEIIVQQNHQKDEDKKGGKETDSVQITEQIYGTQNQNADANHQFLFDAIDCWIDLNREHFFADVFNQDCHLPGKITLYKTDINLFDSCCIHYNEKNRQFSLQQMLMLYAVLVHLTQKTEDFSRRMRVVRNLIIGSEYEVRRETLPDLLTSIDRFMQTGNLKEVKGYNRKQLEEEKRKAEFLTNHPHLQKTLFRLEDHQLTRGCIAIFDLDPVTFVDRAEAFHQIFPEDETQYALSALTGALLATGDYSQQTRWDRFQFGSQASEKASVWRQLLTNTASNEFSKTRTVLMRLLDGLHQMGNTMPIKERLGNVTRNYLTQQEQISEFDWRYYLVKYQEMREGKSGLYVSRQAQMCFNLCMLDKSRLNSYYRDPFLFAVFKRSEAISGQDIEDPWYFGYEGTEERWMKFIASPGAQLKYQQGGLELTLPINPSLQAAFDQVLANHGVDLATRRLDVPQVEHGGTYYDTQDRVKIGIALVRDLIALPTWSESLTQATRDALVEYQFMTRDHLLHLKNLDSRYGTITEEHVLNNKLIVCDKKTGEETVYPDVDALINDGWVID